VRAFPHKIRARKPKRLDEPTAMTINELFARFCSASSYPSIAAHAR